MKPDWDDLGEKYENSKKVLIGDVDCTGAGEPLCKKYGVQGYPTLKYFNPPDTEGETYDGGRTLKELKKFAKTLGPMCTVATWSTCTEKQKAELQPYIDKGEALAEEYKNLKGRLDEAKAKHDSLMESLQQQYKESEEALKSLTDTETPKLKLMKAAIGTKTAEPAESKDEI